MFTIPVSEPDFLKKNLAMWVFGPEGSKIGLKLGFQVS